MIFPGKYSDLTHLTFLISTENKSEFLRKISWKFIIKITVESFLKFWIITAARATFSFFFTFHVFSLPFFWHKLNNFFSSFWKSFYLLKHFFIAYRLLTFINIVVCSLFVLRDIFCFSFMSLSFVFFRIFKKKLIHLKLRIKIWMWASTLSKKLF